MTPSLNDVGKLMKKMECLGVTKFTVHAYRGRHYEQRGVEYSFCFTVPGYPDVPYVIPRRFFEDYPDGEDGAIDCMMTFVYLHKQHHGYLQRTELLYELPPF